jgi:phosphatidylglycerophosphatase C
MATKLNARALLDRLERVRGEAGDGVLASDGDGTLWRGDIGEAFFETAVARGWLRAEALPALRREAAEHGVAAEGDASEVGRRLLDAHRAGRYPNRPAFAMMAWALAGHSRAELAALARVVLDEFGFAARVRAELVPVTRWAASEGVPFFLVSASPRWVVVEAALRLGLAPERVIAMDPEVAGERLLPALAGLPTYAEGKLARLREETGATLLAAFGDSDYDFALLEAARVGVAVAPSAALAARVEALPHGCVLQTAD